MIDRHIQNQACLGVVSIRTVKSDFPGGKRSAVGSSQFHYRAAIRFGKMVLPSPDPGGWAKLLEVYIREIDWTVAFRKNLKVRGKSCAHAPNEAIFFSGTHLLDISHRSYALMSPLHLGAFEIPCPFFGRDLLV